MLKKRPHGVTVVQNDSLFFIVHDSSGAAQIVHHIELKALLGSEAEPSPLPPECGFARNSLLIVPDYWFDSTVYLLHSTRSSVIHSFIERKLQADYPDLAEVSLFYHYSASSDGKLLVNFLQNADCFKLYQRLEAMGISPERISTPAFLWAGRLAYGLPDFHETGCCLVHLTTVAAFLYFFSQGRFLFSRSIAFPKSLEEPSDKLNALAYEINQSVFLFSQKAKSELAQIRMVSSDPEDVAALSSRLDRPIQPLEIEHTTAAEKQQFQSEFSSVLAFGEAALTPFNQFVSVSHKIKQKALEWKPLQLAGITLGLILILLLSIETCFLWQWKSTKPSFPLTAEEATAIDSQTPLAQYADALDIVIAATSRRSLKETFANALKTIPETFSLTGMDIELEPEASAAFKGEVKTHDIAALRNTFSVFIDNIDMAFSGHGLLNKQDIKISAANEGEADQGFAIEFRVNMP